MAVYRAGWPNRYATFPVLCCGARNVMTIARELHRLQRSRSFTFTSGNVSPRCALSFTSDIRAACLHMRQYAP
jgi:hypothetical protein